MADRLGHADSFTDLVVYQKTRAVTRTIFDVTKTFPKEERYSLTDQVRRSSRSMGAQIAEAWGKRRFEKHFISKLTDADAERLETLHWIGVALDCGYITREQGQWFSDALTEVGRMLHAIIEKANAFCGEKPLAVREFSVEYLARSSVFGNRPDSHDHADRPSFEGPVTDS